MKSLLKDTNRDASLETRNGALDIVVITDVDGVSMRENRTGLIIATVTPNQRGLARPTVPPFYVAATSSRKKTFRCHDAIYALDHQALLNQS